MMFYTDETDIELLLQSISSKLRCDGYVLYRHGDATCQLEIRKQVKLVYISWDVVSSDGELVREGLCAPLEDIESVTLDEDRLTIRSVFNCTVSEKLTGKQTLIFEGTVCKVVTCKEFESLLEDEQYEIENNTLCLH